MKAPGAMASLCAALTASAASATMPATFEEVVCRGSSAVVATVLDARSHDCRLNGQSECYNYGTVGLTLRVVEVLAPSRDGLKPGDELRVAVRINNDPPLWIGKRGFARNLTEGGGVGLRAGTGKGVSDAEVRQELVGRRFLFNLYKGDPGQPPTGEAWQAMAYEGEYEAKVRDLWPRAECRRWLRD